MRSKVKGTKENNSMCTLVLSNKSGKARGHFTKHADSVFDGCQ